MTFLAGRSGGFDESELVSAVASSGGPRPSGEATAPDFVRFHDDKVKKKRRESKERKSFSSTLFPTSTFRPELLEKKTQNENENKKFNQQSTYTGVHARGGPTKFDGGRDLAALCDRSAADVRGVSSTFARPR